VVTETGVFGDVAEWIDDTVGNVWVLGVVSGLLSGLVDSFTIAMSDVSLYQIADGAVRGSYAENFVTNGNWWKILSYCTAVGGCLLSVGSVSGLALMKMEHVRVGWYMKNLTPKVLAGALVGLLVLWLEVNFI
jgi:Na+/H+ antiporter NhaD/arsenite permease-like protein